MGNFYVSFVVRSTDQKKIADVLRLGKRRGFVLEQKCGVTVVADKQADSQDPKQIEAVGNMLSIGVKAPVLAVLNHDDDVLMYMLVENGKIVDQYNSCPDYFGGEGGERGGNAAVLCATFGVPGAEKKVKEILQSENSAFAMDLHLTLMEALGVPGCGVCVGYGYIQEGESDFDAGSMIEVSEEES